ncbi:MAG: hypothetical protein U1D31_02135 [Patescibacteria group bacterium]|nr:hypothetical protein [bacterium]MDZ4240901.1 hypothetical protein [Patescibacteria group bacterium]
MIHHAKKGLIHQNFQKKVSDGFTLVETLVAITVLMGAITAPLYIASQGIGITALARDQVIAAYLAQDAVEYVVAKKKQNTLDSVLNPSSGVEWLEELDSACTSSDGCAIDTTYTHTGPLQALACASSGCPPLKFNSTTGAYGYDEGAQWTDSRFTRTVVIVPLSTGATEDEAVVAVTISWKNSFLQTKTFTLKTNIYNTVL